MQGLHILQKFLALLIQAVGSLEVIFGLLDVFHLVERLVELCQHVPLRHLVAVQFQAEGSEADLLQSTFHHFKGSHLLGHEEHALALEERIGDQVGDGLRLAGARRAIEDEAVATSSLIDSRHLRRIDSHRQSHVLRLISAVEGPEVGLQFGRFPRQASFHEAIDDGILLHLLVVDVNVVPHQELAEREESEDALSLDAPTFLFLDGLAQHVEDFQHIHSMLIKRQFFQSIHFDAMVLAQELHQRDVEHNLLVTLADAVTSTLIDHLDRHQQDGRIACHLRLVGLIPPHGADSQIERVGTGLFDSRTCSTIESLELQFRLLFPKGSMQSMLGQFLFAQLQFLFFVGRSLFLRLFLCLYRRLFNWGQFAIGEQFRLGIVNCLGLYRAVVVFSSRDDGRKVKRRTVRNALRLGFLLLVIAVIVLRLVIGSIVCCLVLGRIVPDAELHAVLQEVLHLVGLDSDEPDNATPLPDVEQRVAERKVKQLAFPNINFGQLLLSGYLFIFHIKRISLLLEKIVF